MKKLLLAIAVVVSAVSLNAQSIGIQAGLNFASGTFDDPDIDGAIEGISGIRIGPVVQFPIGTVFEVHSGAIYSQQGFEIPDFGKTTLDYIDVPIALAASFDLGGIGAFVKAGPVLGIGIGGKALDSIGEEKISFGSDEDDDFKLLDVGGEIGAGIKLGTLQIAATYDISLSDTSVEEAFSYKNKIFHISLSFVIGR